MYKNRKGVVIMVRHMSKVAGVLACLLMFSFTTSSFASDGTQVQTNFENLSLQDFYSFEDIPQELLDPNFYSEDEIIYIPNEYLNPHHPDSIGLTFIPGNTGGGEFQTFAIGATAGIYFIPGIGQIALTVTGALVIGGVTIAVGSWLYNQVAGYFAGKAYADAKNKGTKTNEHSSTSSSSLPVTGKEYSSKDRVSGGKVVQRRYYDKSGKADLDIDYTNHGNPAKHPKVPHRHDWVNGSRGGQY